MSEKKLLPKLRFKGFDDEWKSYKIGDISKTYSGGTPSTSIKEYYEGDIPFIKSGEINNDITEQHITEDAINNSSAKRVQKGDLLLALYGATSGEVAISKINGAINQAVLKIDNDMDNYFQYNYFLKYKEQITHKYLQGGQGNLSANIIKKLEFKFPELSEQQKISKFLLLIDKKIQFLEKKHTAYQDFKKYLMQQIFAQKLRFDFTDKWDKYNLGDISTIGKGFTPSTSNPNFWDGDINWLSIADMNQGKYIEKTAKKITEEGCKNKKIVEKDTLIMSFKLTIGRLGILKQDMFTNEAICNFKWKNNNILTEYMYYYLSSINILKYGSQAAKGITLNNDTLSTIPVLLPSIEEQQKIVDILSNTDIKIQFIQDNIEDIEKFKKGLLQQMFV